MAKVRDYAVTQLIAEAATIQTTLPQYQAGDLLLAFVSKDAASTGVFTIDQGWTIGGQNSQIANAAVWAYKENVSASETAPTFTQGDVDSMLGVVISIQGAPTASAIDASSGNGNLSTAATGRPTIAGVTTTTNNALVFYALGTDLGVGPTPEPGVQKIMADDTGTTSLGVAWTLQPASGSTGTQTFTAANPTGTSLPRVDFCVAIKDGSSGTILPAYHDRNTSMGILVEPVTGTIYPNGGSFQNSLSIATIGSKSTSYDAISSVADSGINPFHATAQITPVATSNLGGSQFNFAANRDFDPGILLLTYTFTLPRDYIDTGFVGTGGIQFVVADASNNYESWMIGAQQDKTTKPDARNIIAIQPSQTVPTIFASSSVAPNLNAINKYLFLQTCPFGAGALNLSMLVNMNRAVIAGGGTSTPITFDRLMEVLNGFVLPFAPQTGQSAQVFIPVQIGGSNRVYMDVDNFSLSFPQRASQATGFLNFHVDENTVGFIFDGRAGDTVQMKNGLLSSPSRWKFEFSSSVSPSATWDFNGLVVINAVPVLRDIGTSTSAGFHLMSFVDCAPVQQNTATLSNCTFDNTQVTSNDPGRISGCNFNSGGTGHAIEITTTGSFTFTENEFTGYGANNTTNASIYNNSGGAVTLNIVNGPTPTVRNGSGASTTLNNNVTITITGLKDNTEVRIYNTSTTTELAGTETATDGTTDDRNFAFSATPGTVVDIVIISLVYENERIDGYVVPSANTSIPIQQRFDRNYTNPVGS